VNRSRTYSYEVFVRVGNFCVDNNVYFDEQLQYDLPRRSYTHREEARENDFIEKCCKFSVFIGRRKGGLPKHRISSHITN